MNQEKKMISNLEKYLINENVSIKEALEKVDDNHFGFIFLCNKECKVVGLATDGDIRRALISGVTIEEPISKCANAKFLSASLNTSREILIKRLDSHIKFIPILDDLGRLNSVI